ncbi:hypothetical protein [Candidatus Poriferisodalis sp.]|uniref:hypothetical protein n=1 Tax=Candidatus Poriferisodalis sp. TaxID=3101277 RepID=UPI003B5255D1
MIDPTELVAVARNMLEPPGGNPSEAAVRRSMSTSYYALFWALNAEVAAPFQSRVHAAAHRLAEHGVAVDACRRLARPHSTVPWLTGSVVCDSALRSFALAFIQLQQDRLRADYDTSQVLIESEARANLDRAESALDALRDARRRVPEQVQALCVASIARSPSRVIHS